MVVLLGVFAVANVLCGDRAHLRVPRRCAHPRRPRARSVLGGHRAVRGAPGAARTSSPARSRSPTPAARPRSSSACRSAPPSGTRSAGGSRSASWRRVVLVFTGVRRPLPAAGLAPGAARDRRDRRSRPARTAPFPAVRDRVRRRVVLVITGQNIFYTYIAPWAIQIGGIVAAAIVGPPALRLRRGGRGRPRCSAASSATASRAASVIVALGGVVIASIAAARRVRHARPCRS